MRKASLNVSKREKQDILTGLGTRVLVNRNRRLPVQPLAMHWMPVAEWWPSARISPHAISMALGIPGVLETRMASLPLIPPGLPSPPAGITPITALPLRLWTRP